MSMAGWRCGLHFGHTAMCHEPATFQVCRIIFQGARIRRVDSLSSYIHVVWPMLRWSADPAS